ncbi:hypothetical protein [Scytonema sp. UIC 10036]|nr:hypothetical protein [Scytonema sp. UIC 10036]
MNNILCRGARHYAATLGSKAQSIPMGSIDERSRLPNSEARSHNR